MASKVLPKSEQNFIRFVKVCLDVLKLPLVDILGSEFQPADLYNEIQQHSCSLLNGKNKLDSNQRSICLLSPPAIPDYNKFDVTLLYKLIRNLCPSLAPTKGWGNNPVDADIQIGDDIERLRLFRNKHIHEGSSELSDNDFETFWKNLKSVFQRIQSHMTAKGYKVNYEENLINIKQLDLGDELIDKYKVAYLIECEYERRKQANDIEKAKIEIKGPTSVLCGNNAKFTAYINPENLKGWSITWQKKVQETYIRINLSTEKYSGSTDKNLVIRSVCKGDTGEYKAILSRDSEEKNISVSSNAIVLQATGGPPIFDVWDVTTGMEGIKIHYGVKKRPPYVNKIKWIKDKVPIFNKNKKYEGGELNDCYFTITSPTTEDRGNYSCVIKNAVGSVQKDVKFDVPNVEISTEQEVYFGSKTSFTSRIVSCPSLDGVEWQQSNDGKTFKSIIISKPKYYGSSCDPKSPLLIIPKVKFEDKLYYRLLVWNKIGEQYSNTVSLDVKGSLPNITINHRTCVSNRSITLIGNVFLYGKFPAVKNVFWTKNGEELDTKGSGGRYSEVTVDNPSLAIFEVNEYDAGSYQLTATNALGSTTSDFLILDVPDVSLAKPEKKNSGFWFTVTIQSIPAPDFAQWSMKEKSSDTFIPIDENADEFKGTSNTLPHPVLVVNPNTDLENYCFQIEVRNFIGSCKKITPGEGSSEDSFTNGNQGGLSKIYLDGGTGLKFAKLFDDIAELFPEKKTRRLKDFIQNSQNGKHITFFAQTVTTRDCLEILRDHKLFTPWDVIFMQYLLKNTECKELFEKCVAYAEAHWALCFYEKEPENGFTNVQFHVRANLSCYTQVEIRQIQETVADIVGCSSTEVFVNGYSHSSSFLAVLSIEKKHVKKLLTLNQQEKDKLSRLKIDFFIVDSIKVYLESPQDTSFIQFDMDTQKTDVKYGIQVSEISHRHTWDIVAAFDIGTSYSGYAYSDRKEVGLGSISFNQWSGNMVSDPKAKAPTTVLFDKDMNFHSFGYEAEDFYATQVCEKKNDDWYRFKNFKMVLYRDKNVNRYLKILDDSGRASLLALEVFSQTIKSLKSHFENTVTERALQFDPGNVLYVVTVPAIWKQSAKLFMKGAAVQAGIPETQLLIALEPEAAAMYCKSLPNKSLTETFKPHKRYMVLDLGGGTSDVVVHDVLEDGGLAEVYKASGGDSGGTMVNREFERYIQNIFKSETCLKELWSLSPRDAYDLEREFEMQKRMMSNKSADIRLKLPARLKQVGNIPLTSSITFDHIYITYPKFKEFFENTKNRIISMIKDILNEVGRLDQIILVGGFSNSRYLYDQLKSNSDISSIGICCPKTPGLAVLQGAVLFGYNPKEIRSRICRYTFGFGVLQDFDESEHPANKRDVVDGEIVCKDVFDILVHEGEEVKFDDPKFATSKSSHREADRKHIPIKKELFAGKNIPRDRTVYVTEEGIKSLGKITSYAPEEGWSNLVELETKVYFGQTEIKIEDFDKTNNRTVKVEIDFL